MEKFMNNNLSQREKQIDAVEFSLSFVISMLCVFCFFSALPINTSIIIIILCAWVFLYFLLEGRVVCISYVNCVWCFIILVTFLYTRDRTRSMILYNGLVLMLVCINIALLTKSNRNAINIYKYIKLLFIFAFMALFFVILDACLKERILPFYAKVLPAYSYDNKVMRLSGESRYFGLADYPNVSSLAGNIVLCYAIYLVPNNKRIIKLFIIIIATISILLVEERSNIAFVPFALITTEVMCEKGAISNTIKYLFVLFVILLLLVIVFPYISDIPFLSRYFGTISGIINGENVSNGRDVLFDTAIGAWRKSPLIGNGWFYYYMHSYNILENGTYVHAHNLFLELLCDLGIIGAVIFSWPIVFSIIQNAFYARHVNTEINRLLKFTFNLQVYFVVDSIFHVSFYSQNMIPIYFIIIGLYEVILQYVDVDSDIGRKNKYINLNNRPNQNKHRYIM